LQLFEIKQHLISRESAVPVIRNMSWLRRDPTKEGLKMKSFFRYSTVAMLSAVFAVAGFAQTAPANPCDDAAGIAALDAKIRELQPKTDEAGLTQLIEASKQYLEKYGNCKNDQVVLVDYLNKELPGFEKRLTALRTRTALKPHLDRFAAGLAAKNWDDVYAGGRGMIQVDPETYRPVLLVLGSIGLDETAKAPRVTKWNDQTIQFAKQAIAELEAGKKFERVVKTPGQPDKVLPQFGYADTKVGYNFSYKNKDDAIGWMNYTIGYILTYDKKNTKEAQSYLYKATQANSDTKGLPNVYIALGDAVLADPVIAETEALRMELATDDKKKADDATKFTPEVRQQKIDAFKAKNALANAVVERALEYHARAYSLAKAQPKPSIDVAKQLARVKDIYNARFGETAGAEAYIARTVSQPVTNPATELRPVVEATPTGSAASTPSVAPTTAATAKPVAAKPAAAAPAKPGNSVKTVAGTKPGKTR
jgi:hypothetical protein